MFVQRQNHPRARMYFSERILIIKLRMTGVSVCVYDLQGFCMKYKLYLHFHFHLLYYLDDLSSSHAIFLLSPHLPSASIVCDWHLEVLWKFADWLEGVHAYSLHGPPPPAYLCFPAFEDSWFLFCFHQVIPDHSILPWFLFFWLRVLISLAPFHQLSFDFTCIDFELITRWCSVSSLRLEALGGQGWTGGILSLL